MMAKTMVNIDGVVAFRGFGNNQFPTKVITYKNADYIVPDWSVNHDGGDEDDGETKLFALALAQLRKGK